MAMLFERRWREWDGGGLQHVVAHRLDEGIRIEGVAVGSDEGNAFGARFAISCDEAWRTRSLRVDVVGGGTLELVGDGFGHWDQPGGQPRPELIGAIDVDLPITPLTNTLPIRRLGLAAGHAADLSVVYVTVPDLKVEVDRQRYVCVVPGRLYHYESLDSDFERDIEVDDEFTVVSYPGLFKAVPRSEWSVVTRRG